MTPATPELSEAVGNVKRLARHAVSAAHLRFELVMIELQEERNRWLTAMMLSVGALVFGLLTGVTLTLAIALFFWDSHPLVALLIAAAVNLALTWGFFARLTKMREDWNTLGDTVAQLKKDYECFDDLLQ